MTEAQRNGISERSVEWIERSDSPSNIEEETFGSGIGRSETSSFGERVYDEEIGVFLWQYKRYEQRVRPSTEDGEVGRTSWLRRLAAPNPLSSSSRSRVSCGPHELEEGDSRRASTDNDCKTRAEKKWQVQQSWRNSISAWDNARQRDQRTTDLRTSTDLFAIFYVGTNREKRG